MSEPSPNRASDRGAPPGTRRAGWRIARVSGIDLQLDTSVVIVFALIVASLGLGTLDAWHPGWSSALRWTVALGAGVLFLASILLHELAHSLVARLFGIPVPRITLFLFGGISEMASEPRRPGQELLVAIAGPLTSLAIGLACALGAAAVVPPDFGAQLIDDPSAAFASVGVLGTLLLWLGPINLVLGLFNLVPGFPLDGGRVLRALLWWTTGDRARATRWASGAGRVVAWGLMGIGVLEVVGGSFGGLWLVVLGWFLDQAARSTQVRTALEEALQDLRVRDLMRTGVETLPADMTVQTFASEVLRRSDQRLWPVNDADGHAIGTVSLEVVQDVDPARTLGEVAAPIEASLAPDDEGPQALRILAANGDRPLVVLDEHHDVAGLLRPRDIARWLATSELRAA